ncbi:hypothetical protein JGS22_001995 [Streptomyces sp. P38-E01]|uniref:DUF4190 domain-containing protein n=1 Tax=Streptomyces tardus TaxID=2780544 RepID=A0A949JBJ7_9ACTN|nr:hypothetical protein [Streptomyces tardus]MBU7596442.1 hypothetical protein [Streptomyces tardus]
MPAEDLVSRPAPKNTAGEVSLVAGVVAVVCSIVPIVGDLVALPAAFLAVVLGVVGIVRSERGRATNFGHSLIGATLGALAAFMVALMFFVSSG